MSDARRAKASNTSKTSNNLSPAPAGGKRRLAAALTLTCLTALMLTPAAGRRPAGRGEGARSAGPAPRLSAARAHEHLLARHGPAGGEDRTARHRRERPQPCRGRPI